MKITDRLKVEHGVFLQQLRVLERLAREGAGSAVLLAVLETVAAAEEHHAQIEDGLLYPALVKRVGVRFPLLAKLQAEHETIRKITAAIRAEGAEAPLVCRYVDALRKHMESEIHALFVLAEELISEEDLESMCSWNVEHVFAEAGQGAVWADRWLH